MFFNIVAIAGLLVALFFFGCASVTAFGTRTMLRRAWSAYGQIYLITTPFFKGPRYYKGSIGRFVFLHISFITPDGQQIVFKSARVPLKADYRTGDVVKIIIDPTGKAKPRLNSVRGIWGNSFQFVGYGLISLLVAFIVFARQFALYSVLLNYRTT